MIGALDRSTPPEVHPFGVLAMPEDTVETLANGVVFHRCQGGTQPVCSLRIQIPGGVTDFDEAVLRLMTMQLSDGCAKYDANAFAEELDFNGARFSVRVDSHFVVIDVSILSERLPQLLPVLLSALSEPTFPEDRLEVCKARFVHLVQADKLDPMSLAEYGIRALMMGDSHPLTPMITVEQVERCTTEDIRRVHKAIMNPSRFNAYLSGFVDDAGIAAVRDFLLSLPVLGDGVAVKTNEFESLEEGSVRTMECNSLQSAIMIGLPAPSRSHPDYVPLRYTIMALGGYFGSRLMMNIREDKGMTYGISASLNGSLDGSYILIITQTDHQYVSEVLEQIKHEMQQLASNPPEGEELERLQRYAATELAELLDSPQSVMGYYGLMNLVGTPKDYFERQQKVLSNLSSELISRMAYQYLNPEKIRVSMTIPSQKIDEE